MKSKFLARTLAVMFASASLFAASPAAEAVEYMKFREADNTEVKDLYQVFVTLQNVGLKNDGQTNTYLGGPSERFYTSETEYHYVIFKPDAGFRSVWHFNIWGDDGYSIMSTAGDYLAKDLSGNVAIRGGWSEDFGGLRLKVTYNEDGTMSLYSFSQEKYIGATDSDTGLKLVFQDTNNDYSKWIVRRYFEDSATMDLPRHTPVDQEMTNPNLFIATLDNNLYMSVGYAANTTSGITEFPAALPSSDRVFWYFIYYTDGSGRADMRNNREHASAYSNPGNGYTWYNYNGNRGKWMFYPIEEVTDGLILTPEAGNLCRYHIEGLSNIYRYEGSTNWLFTSQRIGEGGLSRISRDRYVWHVRDASDRGMIDFTNTKSEYLGYLQNIQANCPFGVSAINGAISALNSIEYVNFDSSDEAQATLEKSYTDGVASIRTAVNKEIIGKGANLINLRRLGSNLPAYLAGVLNANNRIRFNTIQNGKHGGRWMFEDAGDGKFYIKNREAEGYYIGKDIAGSNPASVTAVNKAGKFQIDFIDGNLVINDGTPANALNFKDNDGALYMAASTDAGSNWRIKRADIVETLPGMPEFSTEDNLKLYIAHRASNPEEAFHGGQGNFSVTSRLLSSWSYWYFLEDPDNDSYKMYSYQGGMSVTMHGGTNFVSTQPDNAMNETMTNSFYIVPFETGDNARPGFVMTSSYPYTQGSALVFEDGPSYNSVRSGNPTGYENCAITFELVDGIDQQAIFDAHLNKYVNLLKQMETNSPFARKEIAAALAKFENSKLAEWGSEVDAAVSNLEYVFNETVGDINYAIEDEAENKSIRFINLRLEGMEKPCVLAENSSSDLTLVDGDADAASTWIPEYVSNGRYIIHNGNGKYIGPLSSDITATNREGAGLYRIQYKRGFIIVVNDVDQDSGLNAEPGNLNICSFSTDDPGSSWRVETSAYSAISDVDVDNSADAPVEYFNLQGVRVDAGNLVPGIYIRRQGTKSVKIVVE